MIEHALSPEIFSIGPLSIRWYGLVYALGFLFAYWYLSKAAKEKRIDITPSQADDFVTRMLILSIVFARLVYVFVYNPAYYFANPLDILAVWQGGLSFHGGLLGAAIALFWTQKKTGVRFYQIADLLVIPFALVLVFGRLANFINAELPGRITTVPWCFDFGDGDCRHPSQLYAAGKNLFVFFFLLGMAYYEPLKRRLKEGTIFWTFVLLYAAGRIIVDFWRAPDPTDPVFFGILLGQWLSLIMVGLAIGFLAKMYWKK